MLRVRLGFNTANVYVIVLHTSFEEVFVSSTRIAAILCVGFFAACDSTQKVDPVPANDLPAVVPAEPVIEEKAEETKTIDESRIRQLLETWVNAQNEGDFQSYSSLYSEKFNGVKRAGAKTTTFDLDGWIADRQRMFQKTMDVEISDLNTVTTSQSAVVRFTQTWASGTFKDVGPKQLVIVDSPAGLRIAREEMLASTVLDAAHIVPNYNPNELAILVEDQYVVLQLDDNAVNAGPPLLLQAEGQAIADIKEAPESLGGFLGQRVSVHVDDKPKCESTIASLHVMARVTPHFGQVAVWTGQDPDIDRLSDSAIAKEIWDLADGARVVVGRLKDTCKQGRHARVTGQEDADHSLIILDVPDALKVTAKNAFRKLDGFKEVQRIFKQDTQKTAAWDSTGQTTVLAFGGHSAEVEYLAVSATAGDGCGDFRGEFWAIFKVGPNGSLTLLTDAKSPGDLFVPTGAVMINGEVVFLSEGRILRKTGPLWRTVHEARIPYFDCPC